MAAENERREWSQTPGMRIDHHRGTLFDFKGDARVLAGSRSADAADTEANAEWGEPVAVLGADKVHLLIELAVGGSTDISGLTIVAQISQHDGANDAHWHDFYVRADPVAAPGRWSVSLASAVALKIGLTEPVGGRYMRFKVYCPGADQTGARVLVSGILDKNSV